MGLTEAEHALREDALAWFDAHRAEFIDRLVEWLRVPSVSRAEDATPGAPFGADVARMFDVIADTARGYGMRAESHDGFAISIRIGPEDREIGLISHVDVVPPGDGWTFEPFEPTIRDGYVIARGARDNKGAALLDLFLLRFLRERGTRDVGVRVILGGAEETGMADMEHYVRTARVPDVSLVTDGFFPVNNVQHGRISLVASFPLTSAAGVWSAGDTPNSVPALARVELPASSLSESFGDSEALAAGIVRTSTTADAVTVEADGRAGHSAFPGATINAAGVLASEIASHLVADPADRAVIALLTRLLADPFGEAAGLDIRDETGRLTLNGGRITTADGRLELTVTMRVPAEHDPARTIEAAGALVRGVGGVVRDIQVVPAHRVPANDHVVELLRAVFDDATGAVTRPIAIGGGTHARVVPRAHTFGPGLFTEQAIAYAAMPQAPFLAPGHGDPHGPDECVAVDNLRMAFGIYAVALARLEETLS